MREYAVPAVIADPGPDLTMAHAVTRHAREAPDAVVFSKRVDGRWVPVTTTDFAADVAEVARGLIAAGLEPGDRVGLMCTTRYEWTLIDYAIWSAGCVTVPIYETSSADQVQWILSDSGARAAFFESEAHVALFTGIADSLDGAISHWRIDDDGLASLVAGGRAVSDAVLEQRLHSRVSTDLATLVYTSGTTGRPKGCELSHRSMWFTAVAASEVLPDLFNDQGSTLLFLPLAHVFGRLIQGACFENRVRLGHSHDVSNLVADLGTFSPTFLLSVPRVFEKVFNTYKQQAHATGKGALFDRAEKVAIDYSRARDKGGPGPLLRIQHAVFEKLVYGPRLRAPLGGSIAYAVSGGAPLGERLGHFFRGIGITILEGYGLTETAAAGSVNTPSHIKIGTVGRPSPGCSIRITEEDSEILMRGESLFSGYWHNNAASAEALSDGWFRTGDIGELDDEGYLRITGRKKEILVTAAGKNVAPAPLEDRIRSHPLISQAMVIGDNERFIAALVTLDPDSLDYWARTHGKAADSTAADLATDSDVLAEVQRAVDDANSTVSHAEAIKEFRVLPADFSESDGTMTPSLKVKRGAVLEQYASTIENIYGRN